VLADGRDLDVGEVARAARVHRLVAATSQIASRSAGLALRVTESLLDKPPTIRKAVALRSIRRAGGPPVAWDRDAMIALRETLARLYPRDVDARRVTQDAGLDPAMIAYDPKPINNWYLILEDAEDRPGKVEALIAAALRDHPENAALQRAAAGLPPRVVVGPAPTEWHGPTGGQLEKIIGDETTLVPINYLEIGVARSRAVGMVRLADGSSGTGFLVRDGILITNHHVLPEPATARTSTVLFNFQETATGLAAKIDERHLEPDALFRSSVEDDWSAVQVEGHPETTWGALALAPRAVATGDRVNIIQHPSGLQKRIAFYSNVVAYVGSGRIQYLTDTQPGSSGAPVFDRDWNVVAVHHSGGWLTEPGGPDPLRQYYRNEGILIDAVIRGLE